MTSQINALGICLTCRFGPTCELLNGNSRPVLQCEQFEMCDVLTRAKSRPVDSPPNRQAGQEEPETNGLLGLCRSCLSRAACTFSRPEAGVWHCEEYQ